MLIQKSELDKKGTKMVEEKQEPPKIKMTHGQSSMNEDVSPIQELGDFPARHV